uniref:Uncharacterized protein n=1 Tax=Cuerna arida TaxID=1464854 RepID=A0A1B6GL53_9HEMI
MNKNLQSPTALTEFAPLSPEPDDSPGISQLLTKLFKRSSNNAPAETKQPQPTEAAARTELPDVIETRWQDNPEFNKEPHSDSSSLSGGDQYRLEVTEGRSLPNVLKRISNLLALKSSVSFSLFM